MSNIRDIRLQRLLDLLAVHGGVKKALALSIGKAPAQVSQWVNGNRTLTEESAREIEKALKMPAGWMDSPYDALESGKNPPDFSGDHPGEGVEAWYSMDGYTVKPSEKPPRLAWEDLLTNATLPARFELAMPDDSMEPFTPRGTILVLSSGTDVMPGHGVLVRDAIGNCYIRSYQQGPAGRWVAQPRNTSYVALDSERDGLEILATVVGRMSGVM